jgi:hypothetical protein
MERTKILYGNDRADQLSNTNNVSRSRLVFSSNPISHFLLNRGNLQLPLTSQQSHLSDNKQLTSSESLIDEMTPTRPDISFP